MTPTPLTHGLEIVPKGRKRVDLETRYDLIRPEISGASNLDGAHAKESHLPSTRADAPGSSHDYRDHEKRPENSPARPAQTLSFYHRLPDSSRCFSSGPVRVMSPAPMGMTTSPFLTKLARASASSEREPRHAAGRPARDRAAAIRSDVTPGIGFSRAG